MLKNQYIQNLMIKKRHIPYQNENKSSKSIITLKFQYLQDLKIKKNKWGIIQVNTKYQKETGS